MINNNSCIAFLPNINVMDQIIVLPVPVSSFEPVHSRILTDQTAITSFIATPEVQATTQTTLNQDKHILRKRLDPRVVQIENYRIEQRHDELMRIVIQTGSKNTTARAVPDDIPNHFFDPVTQVSDDSSLEINTGIEIPFLTPQNSPEYRIPTNPENDELV